MIAPLRKDFFWRVSFSGLLLLGGMGTLLGGRLKPVKQELPLATLIFGVLAIVNSLWIFGTAALGTLRKRKTSSVPGFLAFEILMSMGMVSSGFCLFYFSLIPASAGSISILVSYFTILTQVSYSSLSFYRFYRDLSSENKEEAEVAPPHPPPCSFIQKPLIPIPALCKSPSQVFSPIHLHCITPEDLAEAKNNLRKASLDSALGGFQMPKLMPILLEAYDDDPSEKESFSDKDGKAEEESSSSEKLPKVFADASYADSVRSVSLPDLRIRNQPSPRITYGECPPDLGILNKYLPRDWHRRFLATPPSFQSSFKESRSYENLGSC